jgi:hypothetical protein
MLCRTCRLRNARALNVNVIICRLEPRCSSEWTRIGQQKPRPTNDRLRCLPASRISGFLFRGVHRSRRIRQVRHPRFRRSPARKPDKEGGLCEVSLTTDRPHTVLAKRPQFLQCAASSPFAISTQHGANGRQTRRHRDISLTNQPTRYGLVTRTHSNLVGNVGVAVAYDAVVVAVTGKAYFRFSIVMNAAGAMRACAFWELCR